MTQLPTQQRDFNTLCLEFLKVLARAIVQIGLYKSNHPSVGETLAQAGAMLKQILPDASAGGLNLAVEDEKVLANSIIIASGDKLPGSIRNLFERFHIHSIGFSRETTPSEIGIFCGLAFIKFAPGAEVKPGQWLKSNGVENIRVDEAVYAKVDKNKPNSGSAGAVSVGGVAQAPQETLEKQVEGQSLENAVQILARKATSDPAEQKKIIILVMEQFKKELQQKIEVATSQLKQEKRAVENDKVRTESVMTSAADGVVVVDSNGKILMMNPVAEQISGKKLSEAAGKPVFDMAGLEKQVIALAKEISFSADKDVSKEINIQGDSEFSKNMRRATAIVKTEEGKIVGTMSVPTDVAKYKKVQSMQDEFIANVTHELRSPLTAIRTALEMLDKELKTRINESDARILNNAIRNAERLGSLITDILDFSKLESGEMRVHPAAVSPVEIAAEAVEAMHTWARTKYINLSAANLQETIPDIYADRRRTVQILINLISNAIKFTPNRGTIEIIIKRGPANLSQFIGFSVKDTGCGISKEDQAMLFQKFAQFAAGEKQSGSGLGLAITKALTIMQGGFINVESEQGKGSVFTIYLPLYSSAKKEDSSRILPQPAPKKSWWQKLFG